jgi:hypothetical protein
MAAEPTTLAAWAGRQPDNKRRKIIAYVHLKASRTPLPVRRERGRVSQPLTPRVKSVMPLTSTYVFDSVFNSEHSPPERLERLFSCPHHRSYTERCASRPLVQQRAANARGDAPLLRSSSKQSARCMSVGGDRNDVDEALRSSSYAAGGSAIGLSATDAYRQSLGR